MKAHVGSHLHQFHGGLQLLHYKALSCQHAPQVLGLVSEYTVALRQHAGHAAKAVVSPGDKVLRGQLIGVAEGSTSACVHAPTSGRVSAVSYRALPGSEHPGGLAVVIEADGEDRGVAPRPLLDWQQCEPEALRQHLAEMGLVGLGGAVFPSHRKLEPHHRRDYSRVTEVPLHTVILNGAECEPYLSCDESLMLHHADQVVNGARILRHAAGAAEVVIAIEDRMESVARALRAHIRPDESDWLRIVQVPTYYPEGGERQLIQVLTGEEVPSAGLPQDLGLVCFNVGTAAACHQAVESGQPLIERVVTVTGHCIQQPGNWWVRIGTPIAALIEAAAGFRYPPARLVMGGPLMGLALSHSQLPVLKGSNCILALDQHQVSDVQGELPCINCGFCVKVCPAQLLPQELHWAIRAGALDRAADYGLRDCIECGCCDQVCPSHIPLVEDYRLGKHQLRVQQLDQTRAARAKQRYEARNERLVRRADEIERQRQLRKAELGKAQDAKARIAAALAKKRLKRDVQANADTTEKDT